MANRHFGEIGDIWKHLPLGSLLGNIGPSQYWETHAGSARYPLTPSPERNYGVGHFLTEAGKCKELSDSPFYQLLAHLQGKGDLNYYPGSPYLAMSVLGRDKSYTFCDLDLASLENIKVASEEHEIEGKNLNLIHGDGLVGILEKVAKVKGEKKEAIFLQIDPYHPFGKSPDADIHSFHLFLEAQKEEIPTLFWYSYESGRHRGEFWARGKALFDEHNLSLNEEDLWAIEVDLLAIDDESRAFHPGVGGCGILCGHMGKENLRHCEKLAEALVHIYRQTTLPDGSSGELSWQRVE